MDFSSLNEVTTLYAVSLYGFILFMAIISTSSQHVFSRPPSRSFGRAFRQIFPPLLVKLFSQIVQARRYIFFSGTNSVVRMLRRKHFVDPWTLQDVAIFLLYLGANVTCIVVKSAELSTSALRAGRLALINLLLLFAGPHLSFLADVVGVPLSTFKRIHICASFNVLVLSMFHTVVGLWQHEGFFLSVPSNKFALIGGASLAFEAVFLPILRRYMWYELWLRLHQLNAILFIMAVFLHLPSSQKIFIYVTVAVFSAICAAQLIQNVYRHRLRSFEVSVRREESHLREDMVEALIEVQRPIKIEPGQYVNLWMPHVSTLTSLQTHPFTVVSWSKELQKELKLVVKPANGFTKRLFEKAREPTRMTAMFSGPHGMPLSTFGYSNVLFIAEREGIFPCLPMLRKILDELARGARDASTIRHVRLAYEDDTFHLSREVKSVIDEGLAITQKFDIFLYGVRAVAKEEANLNRGVSPKLARFKECTGRMPIGHVLDQVTKLRNCGESTLVLTSVGLDYQDELNRLLNKRLSDRLYGISIPR